MRHGGQGGAPATSPATCGGDAAREALVVEFFERGFIGLGPVLSTDQATRLRDLVERRYRDPRTHASPDEDLIRGDISLMRVFEIDQAFRDLLVLDPILDLVERILGPDCHLIAQNALRTPRGRG